VKKSVSKFAFQLQPAALHLVTFCFSLTTLFSSGKIASISAALIYVVTW
jgi:hypothetical protein